MLRRLSPCESSEAKWPSRSLTEPRDRRRTEWIHRALDEQWGPPASPVLRRVLSHCGLRDHARGLRRRARRAAATVSPRTILRAEPSLPQRPAKRAHTQLQEPTVIGSFARIRKRAIATHPLPPPRPEADSSAAHCPADRASRFRTVKTCHCPPLAVRIPRRFKTEVIGPYPRAPAARSSSAIGRTFGKLVRLNRQHASA